MGLDMWLYARRIVNEKQAGDMEEIGYWRKANSIHNWFVQNVQGGIDNCQITTFNREHLEDLKSVCEHVLANPIEAKKLLPTCNGFFFGSTAYDENYFYDINKTLDICNTGLAMSADYCFTYQSSW